MIKVGDNVHEVMRVVSDTKSRRIPFAQVFAMTQAARAAEGAIRTEMGRVLDRPRAWTLNSLRTVPATRNKPTATVAYREFGSKGTPAGMYLRFLESGGQRRHKRWERALIAAGIMRPSQFAAPARGMALDAQGNVEAKVIVRVLSQLRAFGEGGYRGNLSTDTKKRRAAVRRAGGRIFSTATKRGKLPPGIYQRDMSGRLSMMFAFVDRSTYRRIFRFYDVGRAAAMAAFPSALAQGFERFPPRA